MRAILVTRPAGAADSLVDELESRGYRVIAGPTVLTRRVEGDWPALEQFDWIVLASAAGVEALPSTPPGPRWAPVGQSTAKVLHARGFDLGAAFAQLERQVCIGQRRAHEQHSSAEQGWVDRRRAILKTLTAIVRARAGIVITSFAVDAATWMRDDR